MLMRRPRIASRRLGGVCELEGEWEHAGGHAHLHARILLHDRLGALHVDQGQPHRRGWQHCEIDGQERVWSELELDGLEREPQALARELGGGQMVLELALGKLENGENRLISRVF